MLEMIFSTFHASNIILQQQYRKRNFTKYSELISVLLTTKKTNELLLKNYDLRSTGSTTVSEAHVGSNRSFGLSNGHGRKQDKGFRMSGNRSGPYNRNNLPKQNRDIDQKPSGKQNDICH